MKQTIEILILSIGRSKKCDKSVLEYAIVDLKESQNRKGYQLCRTWFETDDMFNKLSSKDVGKVLKADISFVIGRNGQPRMIITNVYN